MYYEAQPDWSDIDWIHGLYGLMRRDQAWKANLRNIRRAPISLELDIEEGWKRLVASRPLGQQVLVYGDRPPSCCGPAWGWLFLLSLLSSKTHREAPGGAGAGAHHPTKHTRQSPRAGRMAAWAWGRPPTPFSWRDRN